MINPTQPPFSDDYKVVTKLETKEQINLMMEELTVTGDRIRRSRRERPEGVSKFGGSEEGFDGFVGRTRVAKSMKP